MRIEHVLLLTCLLQPSLAWSQDAGNLEDIRQGHRLASELCSFCHVATPDQATLPICTRQLRRLQRSSSARISPRNGLQISSKSPIVVWMSLTACQTPIWPIIKSSRSSPI